MDSQKFDAITRSLATGSNRRRVLKGLAGGVAGALGLALGRRGAEAARGRQCPETSEGTTVGCNKPCRICCGGRCVYGCNDATSVCDASSGTCVSRTDFETTVPFMTCPPPA